MGRTLKSMMKVAIDHVFGFGWVIDNVFMYIPPSICMFIPHFSGLFPLPFRLDKPVCRSSNELYFSSFHRFCNQINFTKKTTVLFIPYHFIWSAHTGQGMKIN